MNKFLIVVDMQNDFINGSLGSNEAQSIVANVVDMINDWDDKIVVTKDTHEKNYMQTREGKYLPVPHCISGTNGWELNSQVKEALKAKKHETIYKNTFGYSDFPCMICKMLGLTTYNMSRFQNAEFHFVGLCTDICVVSNAMILKAAFPEAEFYVHADCCAGVTPETHNAALTTMKSCQINIV